jgi:hypothetical protein
MADPIAHRGKDADAFHRETYEHGPKIATIAAPWPRQRHPPAPMEPPEINARAPMLRPRGAAVAPPPE